MYSGGLVTWNTPVTRLLIVPSVWFLAKGILKVGAQLIRINCSLIETCRFYQSFVIKYVISPVESQWQPPMIYNVRSPHAWHMTDLKLMSPINGPYTGTEIFGQHFRQCWRKFRQNNDIFLSVYLPYLPLQGERKHIYPWRSHKAVSGPGTGRVACLIGTDQRADVLPRLRDSGKVSPRVTSQRLRHYTCALGLLRLTVTKYRHGD